MLTLQQRTYKKELLDGDNIPFADIRRNMEELEFINRRLGGHKITIAGLRMLLNKMQVAKKPVNIVEIGCGGGDNLRAISNWANKKNVSVNLTGIDINAECIAFAETNSESRAIRFIHSDYKGVFFKEKPDIIFSSLFCHHFEERELVQMLSWMRQNTTTGFFINDLHRHWLAYYSIKLLTGIFSKSYLVKNDAPLSVQRGFKKKDWRKTFDAAGLPFFCEWKWAFRWLVVCLHEQ